MVPGGGGGGGRWYSRKWAAMAHRVCIHEFNKRDNIWHAELDLTVYCSMIVPHRDRHSWQARASTGIDRKGQVSACVLPVMDPEEINSNIREFVQCSLAFSNARTKVA